MLCEKTFKEISGSVLDTECKQVKWKKCCVSSGVEITSRK